MPKEDFLRFYKLGNWQELAYQTAWYVKVALQNLPRQESVR